MFFHGADAPRLDSCDTHRNDGGETTPRSCPAMPAAVQAAFISSLPSTRPPGLRPSGAGARPSGRAAPWSRTAAASADVPDTATNSGATTTFSFLPIRSAMARSSASMVSTFHSRIFSRSGWTVLKISSSSSGVDLDLGKGRRRQAEIGLAAGSRRDPAIRRAW